MMCVHIRYFGLSATGYVQNRDMEGECNGLMVLSTAPDILPFYSSTVALPQFKILSGRTWTLDDKTERRKLPHHAAEQPQIFFVFFG